MPSRRSAVAESAEAEVERRGDGEDEWLPLRALRGRVTQGCARAPAHLACDGVLHELIYQAAAVHPALAASCA